MIYIVETDLLKEWSRRAWTSTPNLVSSFWAGLVDIVLLRLYLLLFDFPYIRIVYQEFALIHSCPDLSIGLIQLRNIRITFTLLSDECGKIRETLWRTTRQVKCPSNLSCYTCMFIYSCSWRRYSLPIPAAHASVWTFNLHLHA